MPYRAGCLSSESILQRNNLSTHFDVVAAAQVVSQAYRGNLAIPDGVWLDLGAFRTCSAVALDCLATAITEVAGISLGFERLTPECAQMLTRFRPGIVEFTRLHRIDLNAVRELRWPVTEFPLLSFVLAESPTPDVAALLADRLGQSGRPLGLSLPNLGLAAAQALRAQSHELSLTVRDADLATAVAAELAGHQGYQLDIYLSRTPVPETIDALSGNPGKRLHVGHRASDGWCWINLTDHEFLLEGS